MGGIAFEVGRRRGRGLVGEGDLPGDDVRRRAEHGVGLRLFPRGVDACGSTCWAISCAALLRHMDARGCVARSDIVVPPALAGGDAWSRGSRTTTSIRSYLVRDMDKLPKRLGEQPEWRHTQDYWREAVDIPAIKLDGEEFAYS